METLQTLPSKSKYAPKYTPVVQIEELLRKGLSHGQIATLLNVSRPAITFMIKRHGIDPKETDVFKKDRADLLASKQRLLINNLTISSVKKCSARDTAVSFGILYDKERLERGQSTANIDIHVSDAQRVVLDKVGTGLLEQEIEILRGQIDGEAPAEGEDNDRP